MNHNELPADTEVSAMTETLYIKLADEDLGLSIGFNSCAEPELLIKDCDWQCGSVRATRAADPSMMNEGV